MAIKEEAHQKATEPLTCEFLIKDRRSQSQKLVDWKSDGKILNEHSFPLVLLNDEGKGDSVEIPLSEPFSKEI